MSNMKVASRDEWLDARRKLLEMEKNHTREKDRITKARQALPWVKLEKEYIFKSNDGDVSFSSLFKGASQLIVYHFMFGPDWDEGCVSCSFWADSFNGIAPHLAQRDITFVATSSAPLSKINPYKARLGWAFDWVSTDGSSFNADFNVGFPATENAESPMIYNYREAESLPSNEMHGTSVFAKDEEGNIYHTYSTYGRGLDITNAAYSYIDMTPKGRDEPSEGNPMFWLRRHDSY